MKNNLVIGDTVDGVTLVIKKEYLSLWKGLQFEDGSIKWLMAQYVGNFCCGLAAVDMGGAFGYLNRRGGFQIPYYYLSGEDFVDNISLVTDAGFLYLFNSEGHIIKKFTDIYNTNPFHQGYALIHEICNDGEYKRDALINNNGEFIIPFGQESKIRSPFDLNNPNDFHSDGRIRIISNKSYGYKDLNNEIIIYPHYQNAYRFSEGLAAVNKNGKWGFIDGEEKVIIPFEFEDAESFSEGLAAVRYENKWGCIDKECNTIIPFEYDYLGRFINGEIEIAIEDRWGLMNRDLDIIVEPKFDSINHYADGIAEFSLNGKSGVIDRYGNKLISDLFIGWMYYHKLN